MRTRQALNCSAGMALIIGGLGIGALMVRGAVVHNIDWLNALVCGGFFVVGCTAAGVAFLRLK